MSILRMSAPSAGLLTVVILAGLLVACAPADNGGGDTGGGTVSVVDGVVEISADNLEFDASTIQAPAGEAFTISFANNEAQPHNVAIYTEEGGEVIFQGEIFSGPGQTMDYAIEALEAGTYYFRCDVHPDMEGTVVVG